MKLIFLLFSIIQFNFIYQNVTNFLIHFLTLIILFVFYSLLQILEYQEPSKQLEFIKKKKIYIFLSIKFKSVIS